MTAGLIAVVLISQAMVTCRIPGAYDDTIDTLLENDGTPREFQLTNGALTHQMSSLHV